MKQGDSVGLYPRGLDQVDQEFRAALRAAVESMKQADADVCASASALAPPSTLADGAD